MKFARGSISTIKYLYGLRDVELVYISGKGRMYGSWIDEDGASNYRGDENGNAPDPGYDANDLIENPVYIVENICRTELGMDASVNYSDIDIESFDYAGAANSSRGVYASFGNYNPKFAFSIYQLIDSLDLIQKIGEQCNTWFFFSGDGKLKARTRNRAANYNYYDKIIDYNDITVTKISKTPLDKVFNDITIHYAKDYQSDNLTKSVNIESIASKGSSVNGYNKTLEYILEADLINDEDTATGLANAKLDFYQYQKNIIEFEIANNFNYWVLELCDIIKFSNWDSENPVNGEIPGSSDYFSIFDISKSPDTGILRVKCFEVS